MCITHHPHAGVQTTAHAKQAPTTSPTQGTQPRKQPNTQRPPAQPTPRGHRHGPPPLLTPRLPHPHPTPRPPPMPHPQPRAREATRLLNRTRIRPPLPGRPCAGRPPRRSRPGHMLAVRPTHQGRRSVRPWP
nr:MAG TPA: hypothetical protein [Caudoviricetes sp.]